MDSDPVPQDRNPVLQSDSLYNTDYERNRFLYASLKQKKVTI